MHADTFYCKSAMTNPQLDDNQSWLVEKSSKIETEFN